MNFRKMNNDELIDLLFASEDALPRTAIDEILRRADELIPDLSEIAMERLAWTAELPEWWAPVHATYILGAVGTEAVLTPLMSALRWSDAYDNEWVTEDLPAIFGSMGMTARRPLEGIVADRSAGWSARAIAMDGLAALAVRSTSFEEEMVRMIAAILDDRHEQSGARRAAAMILMDLKRSDCRDALMRFAHEEERRFEGEPDALHILTTNAVEIGMAGQQRETDFYLRNWMDFYEPQEIRLRRKRWAEEDERYRLKPGIDAAKGRHDVHEWERRIPLDDPCPCGSGKKYRRCCWLKIH